jgi:hypothetical protein
MGETDSSCAEEWNMPFCGVSIDYVVDRSVLERKKVG